MAVLRAGVMQCGDGSPGVAQRLAALDSALASHSAGGLDLVVCPELFASGYNTGEALLRMAVTRETMLQRIAGLAAKHHTALVIGYPERVDDERLCNSALCVSATGVLLGHHRKRAIPPGFEKKYFSGGTGAGPVEVFECHGFKCAILICYDAEFPESARMAALAGAEVLIVPTALSTEWRQVAERVMPSRAFENGLWLLYANYCGNDGGLDYAGASCILTPFGLDAARAGERPELITAMLDNAAVSAARERLPYLEDRSIFTSLSAQTI